MQLAFNVIRATVQVLENGRWVEGAGRGLWGGGGARGWGGRNEGGKKKLSTFLPATNDMLENKSHLNKLCFTELGNKRFLNYNPRFAGYAPPFY
jgi:hypothetical protein